MGTQIVLRRPSDGVDVDSSRPEIAAAPNEWFVVWEQEREDTPSYQDIHGRAVIGPFFTDNFETGDDSAWDSSFP